MGRPRKLVVLLLLAAAAACRRDAEKPLEGAQKMAYGVKPAVVRVSALATAHFRYPLDIIKELEGALGVKARNLDGTENLVETGAGGSGSGFIIHPDGVILTSGHVVSPTRDREQLERELRRNGAIEALVRHFPVETLRAIHRSDTLDRYVAPLAAVGTVDNERIVNQVELSNGETLPFTIKKYSPALHERGTDLAILQIERKRLPSLPLGDSDAVQVGQSIWSVGYPNVASSTDPVIGGWLSRDSDLEATVNPGTITAIKRNAANAPVFQSNVAIYHGNSGGPAVNADGEVIGISTWGHASAEQIKFLVPVNVARQLLADAKMTASAGGEFNQHYRAALDAAGDGKWLDAKKELVVASTLFPRSPDLVRFGNDADRAIRRLPLWRLYPVPAVAVLLAGALFIVTSTFFLVRANAGRASARPGRAEARPVSAIETVVAPNGVETASASMLGRFTILNGARAGEKLGLGGSGIRIGRESTICEIVLENPKVSRLHAEVVSIDGKTLLIDRNSSNGTYVNDQKIDKRFLQDGDIIYFGGRNAVAVAFHA
jgi:serine protease Do